VQSCWAQESTQRPTAQMIENYFKSPSCTALKNTYQIEPKSISFVFVARQIDSDKNATKESVWIAGLKGDTHALVCYRFIEQSSLLQNILKRKNLHPKPARPKLYETVSSK